jgi:hypothetical protein
MNRVEVILQELVERTRISAVSPEASAMKTAIRYCVEKFGIPPETIVPSLKPWTTGEVAHRSAQESRPEWYNAADVDGVLLKWEQYRAGVMESRLYQQDLDLVLDAIDITCKSYVDTADRMEEMASKLKWAAPAVVTAFRNRVVQLDAIRTKLMKGGSHGNA